MNEKYRIAHQLEVATGELNYTLRVFGDQIAKEEGYKSHEGLEAVHYYLVEKYKWLPSVVKSMSNEDIRFLLEEKMVGWRLPDEAIPQKKSK